MFNKIDPHVLFSVIIYGKLTALEIKLHGGLTCMCHYVAKTMSLPLPTLKISPSTHNNQWGDNKNPRSAVKIIPPNN
jgi:hypothetical protein